MDVLRLLESGDDGQTVVALTGLAGEVLKASTTDSSMFLVLAAAEEGAPRANCAVEGKLDGRPAYYWGTDQGLFRRTRSADWKFDPVEDHPKIRGRVVCLGASDKGTCMGVHGPGGTRIAEISPEDELVGNKRIVRKQATVRLLDGRTVRAFHSLGGHRLNCAGPLGVGNCCEVLYDKLWADPDTFSYGGTSDLPSLIHGAVRVHDRPGEHVFYATPEGDSQAIEADHDPWVPSPAAETAGRGGLLVATNPADKSNSGHEISFWNGREWMLVGTVPWRVVCFLKLDDSRFAVGGRWTDGKKHDEPALAIFAFPPPSD